MPLSDAELLYAAQSGGETSTQARQELHPRFDLRLRYLAGRACRLYCLNPIEADEVVQIALAVLLNPATSRFDPGRSESCDPYLWCVVQNAARTHSRCVHKGAAKRHHWRDPSNARFNLPASVDDIRDGYDALAGIESRDLAAAVVGMASPDERTLIDRVFFGGESLEAVAGSLGVDRSTVSRRLSRFYRRVRAKDWLFYAAALRCPN